MHPDKLEAALATLGWTPATLARKLGCARSLPHAWIGNTKTMPRGNVPPPVARWLRALVKCHENNPAPEWRTQSAKTTP